MDWKKIGKSLLFPPTWVILLLAPISAVLLILVFVKGWDTAPIAYGVYVLSAYTVTVLTVYCVIVFPRWYRALKEKAHANRYTHRYLTDVAFRTQVLLYASLGINLLYILLNVFSSVYYHTAWFAILAGYYTILALMRFLLLRFFNRVGIGNNLVREYRRSRLCGIILMLINLTLTGAILMILYQNRGYEYNGIFIYIMASYTFYATTHSIIDLVKYRKYSSPVMSAAKRINLSAALVSMLSLETAMLTQFGAGESPQFRRAMIASTGAGVSVTVLAMSVYMIVHATLKIRQFETGAALKGENDHE